MADSNITKRALASALKELMESTPFSKITVSDICAKCNMNRKSFYYHFKDKFDLVNWIFDVEYLSHVQLGVDLIGWDSVLHLCDYFYENKELYLLLYKANLSNLLYEGIRIASGINSPPNNISTYRVATFAGTLFGLIDEWIRKGMLETPEELHYMLNIK